MSPSNRQCFFGPIFMSTHLQFLVVLLVVLVNNHLLHSTEYDEDQQQQLLWQSAKRRLAERTRRYVRQNPISDELQSFIEELRSPKRRKRQDYRNMYAIKDGNVVSLDQLEGHLPSDDDSSANFTVVPLIIPIRLETNMTTKDRPERTEESGQKGGRAKDDSGFDDTGTNRPILGRGEALLAAKAKHKENKAAFAEEPSTEDPMRAMDGISISTEETVVNNLVDEKLTSTNQGTELNKVLEDVQNLISAQKKGHAGGKEGVLCNVSGYWDSQSGGMTFRIRKTEHGTNITMRPTEPPSEDGFIAQGKWNMSGRIPFPAQAAQVIITLTAYQGRRVAMFLGECRVCDGSETITGDWLVGRTSTNCKDQKASHSLVSDIFRKNNVETLREANLKKMTQTTNPQSTEPGND